MVYQNLKRDADELKAWIADKKRVAQDDSFKTDPASLDKRLLKHEAFIAELKANGAQLQHITQEGQALIAQQHFESPQIAHILEYLNDEWQQLSRLVDLKSHNLEEADDKKALERLVKDANLKLDDIESQLASNEQGSNLRNVKELIQKKHAIDQEILLLERKIADISAMGETMIRKRHYDAPNIQRSIDALVQRFNALQVKILK